MASGAATLTKEEIDAFFDDIDKDKNGFVTFAELEAKLDKVHDELAPEPKAHHLHHISRRTTDPEKGDRSRSDLHDFLCTILPESAEHIERAKFHEQVESWEIPSQKQTSAEDEDAANAKEEHDIPLRRRIRAWWKVRGAKVMFNAFVVALVLIFGIWQMVSYILNYSARAALGWGVILAKASAGALYPLLFFTILSMSRHLATFLRRWETLSRVVNWDRSQSFHIKMSITSLIFATLHAIGHLTGTFLYGSRPAQQDDLAAILGPDAVPKPYSSFVSSRPGWTGLTALATFYTIAILSMPQIRRWSYEIFQLGHLLMFLMIAMLCAHGTAYLLQAPMLGYWLAFPTLAILFERLYRIIRGFIPITARLEVLDSETVCITARHPSGNWPYEAGQYILLQVPSISFWQWHPFTISVCRDDLLQVHIKTEGDWTEKLRDLPEDRDIRVGVDGPFGAPAQRFYDYDRAIIIGSGIGITPFSAIITDLEQHALKKQDPWGRSSRSLSRTATRVLSRTASRISGRDTPGQARQSTSDRTLADVSAALSKDAEKGATKHDASNTPLRRVDFHWMVRERNHLLWFADLLNRAVDWGDSATLDLNIHTHITAKRKNISTHVFRYLLDRYRTERAPYSALTGLKTRSHFGRPDLAAILRQFHQDMLAQEIPQGSRIGVFFCGAPVIGTILADACDELTHEGIRDGSHLKYEFRMEVFN